MNIEQQVEAAHQEWRERFTGGARELSWQSLPPQVGDDAPNVDLVDADGNSRALGEFWSMGPALVLFWRHQGCSCGFDRAARLKGEYADYLGAGAEVVVVGQAEPERAAKYKVDHGIPCTVLCDPDFRAYRAYGLLEGGPAQVVYDAPEQYWQNDLDVWKPVIEERQEKGRPLVDNPWQLPGEFVVAGNGKLALTYRYQYCENYPDPRVHVSAIKLATEGGP